MFCAVDEYIPSEFYSPNGTRIIWIPKDVDDVKPKLGTIYQSIDEAMDFYKKYACASGFDVRKTTTKKKGGNILTHRYMVCSRQGFPDSVLVDTMDNENNNPFRNSNIKRMGCKACAKFKRVGDSMQFQLYEFEERHNHSLVSKQYKHLLKMNRQLDFSGQTFIQKMANSSIGATKAYHLYHGLHGGYNINGGTVVDYKNHARKVNCFVGKDDAQMLVDKYEIRKREDPNFSFEYRCEKGVLSALFWADEICKANYKEFGDILSFDATFRTNK